MYNDHNTNIWHNANFLLFKWCCCFTSNINKVYCDLRDESCTFNWDINTINTISSTIPYQGYGETQAFLGQAEYEIFPDVVNGILDKPIFLLDGFDPGDARKIPNIYSIMNYGTTGSNLADDLRAQGFDVIILNFPTYTRPGTTTVIDGGVDYIQRNAMILVELINQINV